MVRWSTALVTIAVMLGGSWWATRAVIDGEPGAFLLRFLLVVLVGTYYLVLFRFQADRHTA